MIISPTQSTAQAALAAFLKAVLPGAAGSGAPAVFSAMISGTTLDVATLLTPGVPIALNSPVLGAAPGTVITAFGTGSGGSGTYTISLSQNAANLTTMATGVSVVAGQQNRAPEPVNPWFAVMTPIRFGRFSTNVDASVDTKFTGSISGTTLMVASVETGALAAGATVFGPTVVSGTVIYRQLTGTPGGAGTYLISGSQSVGSGTLSAGQTTLTQNAECVIQCDCHAPDTTGGDFAQIISTALRDPFGVDFFAALPAPLNGVIPLHADDPRQAPFINDSNQFEFRWTLDVHLEVEQTVSAPTEYADAVAVTLASVEALYPPS